ncbi:MAG: hypothetical protein OQJ93_11210, partial [Ignavibacteriaceae bacterium]|nr:hypothetical protein [Ignavibacteriaceae bacterium]
MKHLFSVFFFLVFSFSVFSQSSLRDFGSAEVAGTSIYQPSDAPVVFLDQLPNQSNGIFSDSTCTNCGGAQVVAANFNATIAGPTVGITEIKMWGGYFPEDIPNTTDDFTIIIHSDASGVPGAVVDARYNLQANNRVNTGVVLFGVHEYEFTFDYSASPVMITTAGIYHVEIYNNSVESGNFFWETGTTDGTNGIVGSSYAFEAPGATWFSDAVQDLSIQINGDDNIVGANFTDDFDSYTAGQQLACQNPTEWTTWSNLPCDPTEDPYISSNYAYSSPNSVVLVQNNDLVRLHGQQTTGHWYMSFLLYIPAGASGYFNQLSGFAPNPNEWAVEVYFDAGGAGRVLNGSTVNFTWQEDTWQQVVLEVDLDSPTHDATVWFGSSDPLTMIASWDWTRGGTYMNEIDANDFFGAAATDEMYMDNYYFGDVMPPIISGNNGILLISENTTGADSVEAWLNALGEMYTRVTNTVALTMPTSDWLMYDAVYYIGTTSSGAEADSCTAYCAGGGNLLVADNDEGYFVNGTPLYDDYLMSIYVSDAGSDGTITGMDIMAGLTLDISADPYPDDIMPNTGAYGTGVPIF